jgi:tryptophan-rich sensory protein
MSSDMVRFIAAYLIPGLLIILFAKKAIEFNARAYPRVYGRVGRPVFLFMAYAIGIVWIMIGFQEEILK